MIVHTVVKTIGGYAREDAPVAHVVGVYTDPVVANQVKLLTGDGATICSMELDTVSPGLTRTAEAMGMQIKLPGASN